MTATRAVPFTSVAFDDGFWAPRQTAVRNATIPFLHQQYEKAGIFAALDVRAPADPLPIDHEVTSIGTKPATPVMYWDPTSASGSRPPPTRWPHTVTRDWRR